MPLPISPKTFVPKETESARELSALMSPHKQLSRQDVVSKIGYDCFMDIENARLGWGHSLAKYAAGTGTTLAAVGVPAAIGAAGLYYYRWQIGAELVRLFPWAFGAFVAEKVQGAVTGIKPLTYVTGLAVTGVVAAWTFLAYKAGEAVTQRFTRLEKLVEADRKRFHHALVEDSIGKYNRLGVELIRRFESMLSRPKEVYELRQNVARLEALLPSIRDEMATMGIANSEASLILNELEGAIQQIKAYPLVVKSPRREADHIYNTYLLAELPKSAAHSLALSPLSVEQMELSERYRLGFVHRIKDYAASLATGALVSVAVPVVSCAGIAAAGSYFEFDSGLQRAAEGRFDAIVSAGVALLGATTLTLSALAAKSMHEGYVAERNEYQEIHLRHRDKALNDLKAIYNGVADYLETRRQHVKLGLTDEGLKLKQDAQNIRQKLPAIQQQIRRIGLDPNIVAYKLRQVLDRI